MRSPASRVWWQKAWWSCCEGTGWLDAHDAGFTAKAEVGGESPVRRKLGRSGVGSSNGRHTGLVMDWAYIISEV